LNEERPKTRHKRLETLNLVSLSHRDPDGRVDLEIVGRTLDLSEGGILLEFFAHTFQYFHDIVHIFLIGDAHVYNGV